MAADAAKNPRKAPRILIVDDDPGIRQLLTVFLMHNGYRVICVANGEEALTHLQYTRSSPSSFCLT